MSTESLTRAHALLQQAVAALAGETGWSQMLGLATRLGEYSPTNLLLIGSQRPDATLVAGYREWQRRGRQVRAGEHGILILAPMRRRLPAPEPASGSSPDPAPASDVQIRGFRTVRVFDITQTDGPDWTVPAPQMLTGAAPQDLWPGLDRQITAAGYTLTRGDCAPANGVTDFAAMTVTVRPDLTDAQAVKTLTHELAHVLLHNPAVRPAGMGRPVAEVEAESVAFLVTAQFGIDAGAYSVPYLTGWSGGDTTMLLATATRAITTARTVITDLATPTPTPTPAAAGTSPVGRDAQRTRPGLAGELHRPDLVTVAR